MTSADRQNRGLHYRRTKYRPGFGVCACSACSDWYLAATRLRASTGANVPSMGDPNPDCVYVNRERVFAEEWEKDNEARPWLNWGHGVLQDLMVMERPPKDGQSRVFGGFSTNPLYRRVAFILRRRDRVITATAIQWLGSNCGFEWLRETLAKCGYELRKIEKPRKERHETSRSPAA